jgi:hypothetical protein
MTQKARETHILSDAIVSSSSSSTALAGSTIPIEPIAIIEHRHRFIHTPHAHHTGEEGGRLLVPMKEL